MADLKLRNDQLDRAKYSKQCMACGAPATCVVEKTFTLRSMSGTAVTDVDRLLELLCVAFQPQRKRVAVPLCAQHRNHWRRYAWIVAACSLACVVIVGLLITAITITYGSWLGPHGEKAVNFLMVGLLVLIGLVLIAAILVKPPIRAKLITEKEIILTGVAESFPGTMSHS